MSNDSDLVSICIPTFRRTTYIRQCLESCLYQTHKNIEIIVHDDTDNDSIRFIVESYNSPLITYIQNKPALGLTAKLNHFLEIARGEWCVIVCDDDILDASFLTRVLAQVKAHPDATLVRSRYLLIDEGGRTLKPDRMTSQVSTSTEFLRDIFLPDAKNFKLNLSGILFRPAQLQALGGFRELYRGFHMDRLAWIQLGAQGKVVCEPTPLCKLRLHAGSLSADAAADYKQALASDNLMRGIVRETLERARAEYMEPADQANLAAAEKNFAAFWDRFVRRSFDKGYLGALLTRDKSAFEQFVELRSLMRGLGVRPFRSYYLYRALERAPYFVRAAFARLIRYYKTLHLH